jgi:hypothetical protein
MRSPNWMFKCSLVMYSRDQAFSVFLPGLRSITTYYTILRPAATLVGFKSACSR